MDRARHRPARPDACHEVRQPALGLLPDLRTGRALVRPRVLLVPVLVGLEGTGDVACQAGRHGVVGLGRLRRDVGRAQHHLGAIGTEQRLLLGRLLVGHDEDAAVALERRGDRQAVSGVAGGRLDDRAARLEQARALGRLDHRQADSVLDRTPRVEHLELREHQRQTVLRPEAAKQPIDPDEWRATDQLEDRFGVLHRRKYRSRPQPVPASRECTSCSAARRLAGTPVSAARNGSRPSA